MSQARLPSEQVAVVGQIVPKAATAVTGFSLLSTYVPLSKFYQYLVLLGAGNIASGTIDAKIRVYTSATGAGAADVSGLAITQLTATDDNKVVLLNIQAAELLAAGKTHFTLAVKSAVSTNAFACYILGLHPHYGPANDHDLANVDEIVTK
jgi:hypothetical protein